MNSGNPQQQDRDESSERAAACRSNHDIRASVAITRGFNQALESSLADLFQAYQQALVDNDTEQSSASVQRIRQLEEDCLFCLSRIKRSIEQLNTRLDADGRFESHSTHNSRTDRV